MWIVSITTVLAAYGLFALRGRNKITVPEEPEMSTSGIALRPFQRLGGADHGWLNTRHHFSFADYYDASRMNWGALRVINDDIILPGSGFPPHPHRNMEIVSYLHGENFHPATGKLEGGEGIRHKDNTGSNGITEPGDVQVMSVGSEGVMHSEFHPNEKSKKSTNLFQIWISPDKQVAKSTWGTRHFPRSDSANAFAVFASGFKEDQVKGALPINSMTRVAGVRLEHSKPVSYTLGKNRLAYAVVLDGKARVNGVVANSHDGIAIEKNEDLRFESVGSAPAEILLVDTHPLI